MLDKTGFRVIVPTDWSNTKRGNFFEDVTADLLKKLRFSIKQRVRVTGAEIDILAQHLDIKEKAIVECKFYSDPIAVSVINELIGKAVTKQLDDPLIKRAFLFSTVIPTKDGIGLLDKLELSHNQINNVTFAFYGPDKLQDIYLSINNFPSYDQRFAHLTPEFAQIIRQATLVITPEEHFWILEETQNGELSKIFAVPLFLNQEELHNIELIKKLFEQNGLWTGQQIENGLPSGERFKVINLRQVPNEENLDFMVLLSKDTPSENLIRSYSRWIDRFLCDHTTEKRSENNEARFRRMQALPTNKLLPILQPEILRKWLNTLAKEGLSYQSLNQARAAIRKLAQLLWSSGYVSHTDYHMLKSVGVPNTIASNTPRLLTLDEIKYLLEAVAASTTSPAKQVRDTLILKMLCIMGIRSEELISLKWRNLQFDDTHSYLVLPNVDGSSCEKELPVNCLETFLHWAYFITGNENLPDDDSFIFRRLYKGGVISADPIFTTDAIWRIVSKNSRQAGLGEISTDDLYRFYKEHGTRFIASQGGIIISNLLAQL